MQQLISGPQCPLDYLTLDDALLAAADAGLVASDVMRVEELTSFAVVLGRSSILLNEVARDECQRQQVDILRRRSGGGAVLVGPGCLVYSVLLSFQRHPALRELAAAHRFVLERTASALRRLGLDADWQGTSDLAVGNRKVSGNSLRCGRDHLLYHGTLLLDFPTERLDQVLKSAPRPPAYRQDRAHGQFVANIKQSAVAATAALLAVWNVAGELPAAAIPSALIVHARTRHQSPGWVTGRCRVT